MTVENIQSWLTAHPYVFLPLVLILGYLLYRLTRWALARVLYRIAIRTETVYDDLVVDHLHPFRFAWLLPLGLIYGLFYATVGPDPLTTKIVLFLIILVVVDLAIALLNGFNDVYQQRPTYTGASITAYIDIIKVLIIVGAIFFLLTTFLPYSVTNLFTATFSYFFIKHFSGLINYKACQTYVKDNMFER